VEQRKLRQLDSATELRDLASPPGNRLEALQGNQEGQHSIRVTDQWCICFVWRDGDAYDVEIVDYQRGGHMVRSRRLPPIHPGEILREDFMAPLNISMNKLALDLHVPVTRIAEIVHERRGITPDTALRLGRYFDPSARFWLNAQAAYDLEVAQDALQRTVERDARPRAASAPTAQVTART
jgi:addiction module HigA family antidote